MNEWMTFNQYSVGIFTRWSLCVSLILRCLDLIIIISEHYGNDCLFRLMQHCSSKCHAMLVTQHYIEPNDNDNNYGIADGDRKRNRMNSCQRGKQSLNDEYECGVVYFDLRCFTTFKSKFSLILSHLTTSTLCTRIKNRFNHVCFLLFVSFLVLDISLPQINLNLD